MKFDAEDYRYISRENENPIRNNNDILLLTVTK